MKVGIYSPYLDTLSGGEKYMLTAASCLSENNEVFVFWDDESILNSAQVKFNIDLSKVKTVKNIFTPNISTINRFKESKKYNSILFLSDGSLPIVSSNLYVHFQFPVEWASSKGFVSRIKLKRIKKIICNSDYTKKHIDDKFGVDSVVIYPPTNFVSDFPKVDFKNKKNIILSVGRYGMLPNGTSFKKQEFMIDSFKKLVDKGLNNWELHLVLSFTDIDKSYATEIKKTIGKYPIKILENISYENLLNEYAKAKLYWHASGFGEDLEIHPERAEHFGITTVEAMENGVVPIVINAGGQTEIVTDDVSGFLWQDEEEFLLKTMLIAKDKEKLEKISKQAIEESKKFSSDIFCQKITDVFI